ncbi:hypothetical protein JOM56_015373 [Amanita muscaria]
MLVRRSNVLEYPVDSSVEKMGVLTLANFLEKKSRDQEPSAVRTATAAPPRTRHERSHQQHLWRLVSLSNVKEANVYIILKYLRPPKPDNTQWVALGAASAGFRRCVDLLAALRTKPLKHVPAALHFSNLSYTLGSRTILDNVSGSVKPGQIMAIMGASGAGKSTS